MPPLASGFWSIVDGGLDALGMQLTPGVRAAIDAHVRLLIAWNASINLTALREPERIARAHVLDSLIGVGVIGPLLDRSALPGRDASLLDLGSGGGYPGVPLSLMLGVTVSALVDSVQKKAGFLRVVAAAATAAMANASETAPVFDVLAERAEDLADEPEHRSHWTVVTARAVGSLAEVAELSLPLVADGGHVVAWKHDDGSGSLGREIERSRSVVQAVGGSRPLVVRSEAATSLGLDGHVLITIRKARPTPAGYPRQATERRRAALLR